MSTADTPLFKFAHITIPPDHVFAETALSFAFVNLKPVVPGHVLVSCKRVLPRFHQLTGDEVADIWLLAQRVGSTLERFYGAESLTLSIQDGAAAGQTVPDVHIHVLPRKVGDFKNNDEVYDKIDEHEKALPQMEHLDLDKDRVVRTSQQMAEEAAQLREAMGKLQD